MKYSHETLNVTEDVHALYAPTNKKFPHISNMLTTHHYKRLSSLSYESAPPPYSAHTFSKPNAGKRPPTLEKPVHRSSRIAKAALHEHSHLYGFCEKIRGIKAKYALHRETRREKRPIRKNRGNIKDIFLFQRIAMHNMTKHRSVAVMNFFPLFLSLYFFLYLLNVVSADFVIGNRK
ncbi:hypothetical protein BDF14DRAFT_1776184 [Spinellus fusiger]|nr:hypothetical protein BDF14DRAFT_1776184 [Spinellus fusiger]